MFTDSDITKSISRVKESLISSLSRKYGEKEWGGIANRIMKIHGLSKDNFDFIRRTEEFLTQDISDVSIDTNANKTETTITGSLAEIAHPINKIVGYRYLYRQMKKLYGTEEAMRLSGEMYDMSLALADSTKTMLPYCFAIDTSKIVVSGRNFGTLPSAPPKRLASYIAALNETVHQISNHVAGALAIGSFFFDVAYMLLFREQVTLTELQEDAAIRKYVENCFQNFVHSVNHLSRNAIESPFTNISMFDRAKLETFLSPDNMGWLFTEAESTEYVIEYILELQRIFMDFFDRGDPLNGGRNFRFPIVTANISKSEQGDDITLLDEDFIDELSHREIYKYNILVSEGSKVASCCRLLNNFELLELGGQMNSFGGSGVSLGSHRVVTINFNRIALEAKNSQEYEQILRERIESAAKILEAHRSLIKELADNGLHPFIKNGWLRLDRMFSTFGVLGIVEAETTLQRKFGYDRSIIEKSLTLLNEMARDITLRTGNIYNIEQIPGESMAPKLAQIDAMIFSKQEVPQVMYSNQFVPLWSNSSIYERMRVDGRYNKLFTGGGIVHFNLGEKVLPEQAKALVEYAAQVGCEHFALNPVYSECEEGHTSFGKHLTCPVCRAKIVEYYTRVVGFFVPVSGFNSARRNWEFPKRTFSSVEDCPRQQIAA